MEPYFITEVYYVKHLSKNMLTRIFAGILVTSQLCVITACGDPDNRNSSNDINTENEAVTTAAETYSGELTLEGVLAGFNETYDGTSFRIVTSNIINSSLTMQQAPYEESNGDRVNDALIRRDALIEEKFGITFDYTLIEPDAEFKLFDTVSKSMLADEDVCDLIFGNMQVYAVNFIENKLIRNIAAIDEIHLEQPWWHQTANRDLTVDGTMLLATGDITTRYMLSSFVILFNQKLFTDYGWEFPYQAVRDGKWTMDMMMEMLKGQGRDLNSDGKMKYDDFFGYTNEGISYPFLNGFNTGIVNTTGSEPVLNFETEDFISKAQKIAELFALEDTFYKNEKTQYDSLDIFADDRALFTSQTAINLALLKEMKSDFGVLPLPKYDEQQDQYHSWVNGYCATAIMIPITASNLSMIGNITEAMAASSRFIVTPEVYEVTLLTKQTRDEESIEMLKLAAEGAMYDMSGFFGWGGMKDTVNNAIMQNSDRLTSNIEKLRDKTIKALTETLELFKGIQ